MSKMQSGNIHHRPSIFCFSLDSAARMQPVRRAPCQMRTLSRVTSLVEPTSALAAASAARSAIRNFLDLELSKKASKLTQHSPYRNFNSDTGDFVSEMLNV